MPSFVAGNVRIAPELRLDATRCAICGTLDNALELYAANFTTNALNPEVFSARRLPDRLHFRLVRCLSCGLVRSDPVADTACCINSTLIVR